jgi:hypothetical protein
VKTKANTLDEWDVEKAKYERVVACLECAQECFAQAKLLALEERAHHGLLTKFEIVNSQIQIVFQCLEKVSSQQSILQSFLANDGESHD